MINIKVFLSYSYSMESMPTMNFVQYTLQYNYKTNTLGWKISVD